MKKTKLITVFLSFFFSLLFTVFFDFFSIFWTSLDIINSSIKNHDYFSCFLNVYLGLSKGIFAFILLGLLAKYFYKLLVEKMIIRIVICKIGAFFITILLGIYIPSFYKKIGSLHLEKNYALIYEDKSRGDENETYFSVPFYIYSKSNQTTKIQIEDLKKQSTIEDVETGSCKFVGYGIINGFKPLGLDLNFLDIYIYSGFQYLLELILNNYLSIIISFLLIFIDYKFNLEYW